MPRVILIALDLLLKIVQIVMKNRRPSKRKARDAVLLMTRFSHLKIWKMKPLCTKRFKLWAQQQGQLLENVVPPDLQRLAENDSTEIIGQSLTQLYQEVQESRSEIRQLRSELRQMKSALVRLEKDGISQPPQEPSLDDVTRSSLPPEGDSGSSRKRRHLPEATQDVHRMVPLRDQNLGQLVEEFENVILPLEAEGKSWRREDPATLFSKKKVIYEVVKKTMSEKDMTLEQVIAFMSTTHDCSSMNKLYNSLPKRQRRD